MTETTQEERDEIEDRLLGYPADTLVTENHDIRVDQAYRLLHDADRLAALEQHVITRSEIEAMGYEVPKWANNWDKQEDGICEWRQDETIWELAPDLRPDLSGPVTLPIVDC
jgi:hypothetical protein